MLDALLTDGSFTGHAEAASMLSAEVTMVVGFYSTAFVAQLLE
jgi:hypothetical protein